MWLNNERWITVDIDVISLIQEFTCSHFFYLLFVSSVIRRQNRIKNLFWPSSVLYMQEKLCEKYKNSEQWKTKDNEERKGRRIGAILHWVLRKNFVELIPSKIQFQDL